MEFIVLLFLVAVGLAWYYNAKRGVPADLVKQDQESTPAPKAEEVPLGTEAVMVAPNAVVPAEVVPAKKPAAKKAPAKKAPAKKAPAKTTTAAKKTVKKKTA
jgi:RNA polymerase primary sigma factor